MYTLKVIDESTKKEIVKASDLTVVFAGYTNEETGPSSFVVSNASAFDIAGAIVSASNTVSRILKSDAEIKFLANSIKKYIDKQLEESEDSEE